MVRSWQRVALGAALVAAIAVAGIIVNFSLLRLTQDANDPVGKLSPRSVFLQDTGTTTTPAPPNATGDDADGHDGDD
jgi:hypothetical protein